MWRKSCARPGSQHLGGAVVYGADEDH
jgi:hypothetical protein